jgi:hypothetical protein
MRAVLRATTAALLAFALTLPARATYNGTVTGTVTFVQQMSTSLWFTAETTAFGLSNQPSINCGGYQQFIITPNSVTDAQTRRNMVAILLAAKATGAQVSIGYDSTGAFCDQGMAAVYFVTAM